MSEPSKPSHPVNKQTGKITLPPEIDQEIIQLLKTNKKVEAVQRVLHLTGAGLKVSKDYVDNLQQKLKP